MIDILDEISICIISDLHCTSQKTGRITTYLHTEHPKLPPLQHPVESFRKLVEQNPELKTSKILLCPGDITDKMDLSGFSACVLAAGK